MLGDLTGWGRSGAIAQAVDLLMSLPVAVAQRFATLDRTTARGVLQQRFRQAVEEAIAAAEAELPDDPWAEFNAALVEVGHVAKANVASMSEEALVAAAEAGKRAYRKERRGASGKPATA